MKDKVASLIAIGIVQFIIYLLFSFVAATLNIYEWHILWRFFYAAVFVIITGIGFNKFF